MGARVGGYGGWLPDHASIMSRLGYDTDKYYLWDLLIQIKL